MYIETRHHRGGAAILSHPYSSITHMYPWQEEHWTPHWMAVRIDILGKIVMATNVYASTAKLEREALYDQLKPLLGYAGPIFKEGDFNCTLVPQINRSLTSSSGRHEFLAIRRPLGRVQLRGVFEDAMEQADEEQGIPAFHAAAYTYFYTLPGVASSSSRLHRWYMNFINADWIRGVELSVPGPASDHNGKSIWIGAPRHFMPLRKPRKVYHVPACAQGDTNTAIVAAIEMMQL